VWQSRYVEISGRLFDSGWTGVFALALVLCKLNPEALLRVCNSLHVDHGNLEFAIARSAGCDSRDCSEPFEHPKIAFLHASSFAQAGTVSSPDYIAAVGTSAISFGISDNFENVQF
jgi:hypothetical protein